jgi:hypothetical protein
MPFKSLIYKTGPSSGNYPGKTNKRNSTRKSARRK